MNKTIIFSTFPPLFGPLEKEKCLRLRKIFLGKTSRPLGRLFLWWYLVKTKWDCRHSLELSSSFAPLPLNAYIYVSSKFSGTGLDHTRSLGFWIIFELLSWKHLVQERSIWAFDQNHMVLHKADRVLGANYFTLWNSYIDFIFMLILAELWSPRNRISFISAFYLTVFWKYNMKCKDPY